MAFSGNYTCDSFKSGLLAGSFDLAPPTADVYKIALYTDSEKFLAEKRDNLFPIRIKNEPWPNPTLKRFHYFLSAEEIIESSDFSFYIDVDSLFVNKVDLPLERMSGIIPTLHPGFYGRVGTPERNPESKAYIPLESKNLYFCGGFFGGDSGSFIEMSKEIRKNIDLDLERGIIAIWHDESHLNHYLFNNPPKFIINNHFAIPEHERDQYPNSPVVFLEKDHELMREKIQ